MDGLKDANRATGLIVVDETNRPQDIDSAVLDRKRKALATQFYCASMLTLRTVIICQHLVGQVYDETVDISHLAARTPLFSGSDLRYFGALCRPGNT
jgi:SpoVK/Ycf46/Vps4 family AAA+-type ATPase